MSRVLLIDFNVFMFRAIFSWYKNKKPAATYTALNMILSCLKRVEIKKDDIVIISLDSPKGSWRREYDFKYKANRKALREKYDINWDAMFNMFTSLLYKLDMFTPFHVIQVDRCESDDIIACATKYFKDKECIIISSDTDFEMLTVRENVKIFSPISKKFKAVKDPYKVLSKKIEKEVSDNLVSPITSAKEFEIRNKIVNLIDLPDFVEEKVFKRLSTLPKKEFDYENLPFNSLQKRFKELYNGEVKTVKRERRKIK